MNVSLLVTRVTYRFLLISSSVAVYTGSIYALPHKKSTASFAQTSAAGVTSNRNQNFTTDENSIPFSQRLPLNFIENKGQMKNTEGRPLPELLFKAQSRGMDIYITRTGLSYVFVRFEEEEKAKAEKETGFLRHLFQKKHKAGTQIGYLRADMELAGAKILPENIHTEGQSAEQFNFYYPHCPNGITGVHSYQTVTITDVYPGIDWVLYTVQSANGEMDRLKYDFVVHPGADPSQITLRYKGVRSPELLADGSLKMETELGAITEGSPYSYQPGSAIQVATKLVHRPRLLNGDKVYELNFSTGAYDKKEALIIDPELRWATYYGGASSFEGTYSMDADGSAIWATGYVNSGDFPTYPKVGAYYQPETGGPNDGFIVKFNSSGVRDWVTYYGGAGNDVGTDIYSDGTHVWMTGASSSTNFPVQDAGNGAYFQAPPVAILGSFYPFILQFDVNGVRKWATFFGGVGSDMASSIISDGQFVWMTGFTSASDFPMKDRGNGAWYQNTKAGGSDLFISQFDVTGHLLWSSYYGGEGGEGGLFPSLATPKLALDDSTLWIAGFTASANFPTYTPDSARWFKDANAGANDIYLLRFNKSGQRLYATFIGGSGNDEAYSISVDSNYVWITGGTFSDNFPLKDPGFGAYFQGVLKSNSDAFIIKLTRSGELIWSTYIGGTGSNEHANAIASDGKQVWISGETSIGFPMKNPLDCSPYYASPIGSGDMMIMQFTIDGVWLYGTYYGATGRDWCMDLDIDPVTGCVFLTGEWVGTSTSFNPTKDAGGGAYYQPLNAGSDDCFFMKYCECPCPLPKPSMSGPVAICEGDIAVLTAAGGNSYLWSTGETTKSISVTPVADSTFTVTVTNDCGSREASHRLIVYPKPEPNVINDTSFCRGKSINIGGVKVKGNSYRWTSNPPGFTSDEANPMVTPDSTASYHLVVTSSHGCIDSADVLIQVFEPPLAEFTFEQIKGTLSFSFFGTTLNGVSSWEWDFGDRSTLVNGQSVSHTYLQEDVFFVTLVVKNGCGTDTIKFSLEVKTDGGDPSGIGNNGSLFSGLRVYPNPFEKEFVLEFQSDKQGLLAYCLLDVQGREIVCNKNIRISTGLNRIAIPQNTIPALSKGMYYLKLNRDGKQIIKSIEHK